MRYMVYRWGFPYLNYPLKVCHEPIYWARTTGFVASVHLITWCLSYIPVWMLTTWFSTHAFDSDLSIHMLLTLHVTCHSSRHSLGSSDSPGPACSDPGAWSFWILLVANQKCSEEAWIFGRPSGALSFQAPLLVSRVFFCNSWAYFVLFIIVYLFVFSHLYHWWCNILVILYHMLW